VVDQQTAKEIGMSQIGRYMPLDLFTYCAASGALMRVLGGDAEFRAALKSYYRDYPDEGRELERDLDACAVEIVRMCETFNRQFGNRPPAQVHDDLVGVTTWLTQEIKRMNEFIDSQSKPWWKRILGGTRFNYSASPIPDRTAQAIRASSLALSSLEARSALKALRR